MDKTPDFIHQQYAFAAHIRDPKTNPAPDDIEDRRMAIYRDLFYNNVENFLASTFPVLKSLYQHDDWHHMARRFFSLHKSHTPLFLEISREFLGYLENEHQHQPCDPAFLHELAHYEWVELAISIAETEQLPEHDIQADLLQSQLVLSSLAWPFVYQFPVQHISPDYQPETPADQPVYLLIYRNTDDEINFLELNSVSARLFALLQETPQQTGHAILTRIANELKHPNPEIVIQGGHDILREWLKRRIVLGGIPA
ncbi:MAG: putative DNA-binding domain-containing protein [Gammaproteobacteria bacterium]